MVLWVEQFNASKEACEWFLTHMSTEPWWYLNKVLIQCPNQIVSNSTTNVSKACNSCNTTIKVKCSYDTFRVLERKIL